MRIKEGFVLRKLKDKYIVVGEGLAQVNFNHIITLNESAAYLWEQVGNRDFSVQELADLLVARYQIAPEIALKDAGSWAEKLLEKDVMTK